ncbi:MAG: hypothetical protein ACD_24C00495G0003 [uncultured bacterium]|uniref:SUF system FeS cluster assembly SufBD core domain-containing protein n=1 Tax=candidate division WWE3 bacterium RBG_16_37_10 TaxID=1802610 RepID=A0A1F4UZW4_UNCKA|nr:MAG: hypothetical protein ACD_24C00495G0003 [uncultured bacterium]OGC49743.1 MAG: hypothetical protein A2W32_05375 [candidate division WWE3 bacterium RBG_16_37_10]
MKTVLLTPKSDQIVKVLEDTQFVVALSGLKNQDTDANPDIVFSFEKEGVSAEILGLFCLKPDSRLKLTTTALHKLPHTSCITKIKGVLYSNTEASYTGKIIIKKDAQNTSSFLENSTLVLGDNTKNTSQPVLEIDADDVKASHGSTTGRISEEQIYYLMSRGISRDESVKMIVEGYFEKELSTISDPKIREQIRNNII